MERHSQRRSRPAVIPIKEKCEDACLKSSDKDNTVKWHGADNDDSKDQKVQL